MSATAAPAGDFVTAAESRVAVATQRQLIWWRFRRHKLAVGSLVIVVLFYLVALFADFLAVTSPVRDGGRAQLRPAPGDPLVRQGRQLRAPRLRAEGPARHAHLQTDLRP